MLTNRIEMAASLARLQAAHVTLLRLMEAAGLLREAREAAGRNDTEQALLELADFRDTVHAGELRPDGTGPEQEAAAVLRMLALVQRWNTLPAERLPDVPAFLQQAGQAGGNEQHRKRALQHFRHARYARDAHSRHETGNLLYRPGSDNLRLLHWLLEGSLADGWPPDEAARQRLLAPAGQLRQALSFLFSPRHPLTEKRVRFSFAGDGPEDWRDRWYAVVGLVRALQVHSRYVTYTAQELAQEVQAVLQQALAEAPAKEGTPAAALQQHLREAEEGPLAQLPVLVLAGGSWQRHPLREARALAVQRLFPPVTAEDVETVRRLELSPVTVPDSLTESERRQRERQATIRQRCRSVARAVMQSVLSTDRRAALAAMAQKPLQADVHQAARDAAEALAQGGALRRTQPKVDFEERKLAHHGAEVDAFYE